MATTFDNIDRLRIATPCPTTWDQMTGDNRIRFCDLCRLNVYNVSELSQVETQELMASSEERLCARLFRRADGTILTKDCPVGLRALRRRVATRAAAIFAAILSLSAAAFGQQPGGKHGKSSCTPQTRITRTDATSDPTAKSLSGHVLDPSGATIRDAKVTATNAATKAIVNTSTDDEGRFGFASIQGGRYSIRIEVIGFKALEITEVTIDQNKFTNIDAILEFSGETVTVGILALPDPIDTSPGLKTTLSGDIIRKLPLQ